MSMISTNDFRPGITIELDGDIFLVIESMHVKPGKGPAFVRSKLRNLNSGAVVSRTFRAAEKIPRAHLEKSNMQYLYRDGDLLHFMDTETFEQRPIGIGDVGEQAEFLKENTVVEVLTYEGRLVAVEMPLTVDLEVVETVPGVKGDTVSGGTKPATLETGAVVQVPLFINQGEIVRVNTETGEYIERV